MIESVMYFGIGFLVAALLCLLFVPLVHNRAVRLTMKRLEAATPLSIAEIRADKDQLRAEFAMSTRRLEMSVEKMKTKTTTQLAELGKKSDAIDRAQERARRKNRHDLCFGGARQDAARPVALDRRGIPDQVELAARSRGASCRQRGGADETLGRARRTIADRRQPAYRDRDVPHPGRGDEGQRRRLRAAVAETERRVEREAPTPKPPAMN